MKNTASMSQQRIRSNERLNFLQLAWATPYVILYQQYIPVLATRLGASAILLGVLTSGSALMLAFATFAGRWWLMVAPRDMRAVILPVIGARSVVVWVPLSLILMGNHADLLVIGTIASGIFVGLTQVAFLSVLPRMTLPERVSTMVSGRWTILGAGMAIGIPAIAIVLDAFPQPINYFITCGFATLTTLGECYTFTRWRPAESPGIRAEPASVRKDFSRVWRYGPARKYIVLIALAQFGLSSMAPLVPLQIVRHLQASNVEYGWYSAAAWLTIAVTGLIRPRLIQKHGSLLMFGLGCLGLSVESVILGLAPSLPFTWLAGIFGGLSTGLFQVTAFSLIQESAPSDSYEGFISLQATVGNIAVFLAPLVTTGLISAGLPLFVVLLICAMSRASAGILALVSQRQTRQPHHLSLPRQDAASNTAAQ